MPFRCLDTANLHVTSQCASYPTPRLDHPECHPLVTEICHAMWGIEALMMIIITVGCPRDLEELAGTYLVTLPPWRQMAPGCPSGTSRWPVGVSQVGSPACMSQPSRESLMILLPTTYPSRLPSATGPRRMCTRARQSLQRRLPPAEAAATNLRSRAAPQRCPRLCRHFLSALSPEGQESGYPPRKLPDLEPPPRETNRI